MRPLILESRKRLLYSDCRKSVCFGYIIVSMLNLYFLATSLEKLNQENDMSYTITTEIKQGYVKLAASGEQTLEGNKELVFRVLEACTENNVTKVLVDIRGLVGQPGVVSDYELAGIAAQEALGLLQKVALLYRQESHEYTTFFETAVRNRGINLLAFPDEGEAIQWLREG